jgi:5-methyltetrahydrofolate--homocysteine methyltransferase
MTQFQIIGENIHTSRIVKRAGRHMGHDPAGREAVRFTDASGMVRWLPIPGPILRSQEGERGRVKHVQAALLAGMEGDDADVRSARAYLQAMALRQVAAGASWLDLNVDECSADDAARVGAMEWLVSVIEEVTAVPLALDSSSPNVIRAGLAATRRTAGRPMVNSASQERLEVLELAAAAAGTVVLSAAGASALPTGADERVANATRMVELATRRGLRLGDLYLDPLVLPVAVRPEATAELLAAITTLRQRLGREVHITGGLSNISFGLPARRIVNDVFIALAREAGLDSGILDPELNHPDRPAVPRDTRPWQLAQDLLLGSDPGGRAFLRAHRAGELGGA